MTEAATALLEFIQEQLLSEGGLDLKIRIDAVYLNDGFVLQADCRSLLRLTLSSAKRKNIVKASKQWESKNQSKMMKRRTPGSAWLLPILLDSI